MTIDISFFGFIRFYFALACPWCASAIFGPPQDRTGWDYFSLHLSAPSGLRPWYIGWVWETDRVSLMLGPLEKEWDWEESL